MTIDVKFWGVRGSCPSPLTPSSVQDKIKSAYLLGRSHGRDHNLCGFDALDFEDRSTYGGNTTCVEVNCGDQLFILDLGTGVRELGKSQMKELYSRPKESLAAIELTANILQSHLHHDHIQGLPFYGPMYLDRKKFDINLNFYGGKDWESTAESVYHSQMDAPLFPINLKELFKTKAYMKFGSLHDGWFQWFGIREDAPSVTARKLNHPQETFGFRFEHKGKSIAFTTDHEPYGDGKNVPYGLAELVNRVDLWITDCQYSHDQYNGIVGIQRYGWGHSHERYIAHVAKEMLVKKVITTHHDPDSDDFAITNLARAVQSISGIETSAAYEGMEIHI